MPSNANFISDELIKELQAIKGEARGATLLNDIRTIREQKGEEGEIKIKEAAKKLKYPIDYDKIKNTEWYPLWMRFESLLFLKNYFGWTDVELRKFGTVAPKISMITKFFVPFFINLKMVERKALEYWSEHYSVGTMRVESNEEKKIATAYIENFPATLEMLIFLEGYSETVIGFVKKNAKSQLVSPMSRESVTHIYKVTW